MSSRRDPVPLGDLLAGLLGRVGIESLETWRTIRDNWGEIVGPPWDTETRPVAFRDGVLILEASHQAAMGVLKYGRAALEDDLARRLGEGVVEEVRVRPPPRS